LPSGGLAGVQLALDLQNDVDQLVLLTADELALDGASVSRGAVAGCRVTVGRPGE
jgi:hypothetical protein